MSAKPSPSYSRSRWPSSWGTGRRQIRESGESGGGLALAGLIIGYIGLAISLIIILVVVLIRLR